MPHRRKDLPKDGSLYRELELADRLKLEGGSEIEPEELRTLLELSSELVAITGYDGHFQLLNKAWETTLGYSREELRAKPFLDFVHPDDRDKTMNMVQRLLPGVPLFSFQNRYLCKDGTYRPIHWRGFTSPQAERYYTVAREVSQLQAVEEQRNALEVICEQSRDAIVMGAANGVITEWTGSAERLLGHSRSAMLGETITTFLFDSNGKPLNILDLPNVAGDEDGVRATFVHSDGNKVAVRLTATSVVNTEAAVTGFIATIWVDRGG
ncbi:MAG TPA: PAS domain S-box protein [Polyangium sp.]|nr:PAS domain S-box protein [Polyangium sp.]